MPPLITFDVTGTLLTFSAPVMQQYLQIAARHNIVAKSEQLQTNFKQSWKVLTKKHPNFGKESVGWQNWWRTIVFETFRGCYEHQREINPVADDLIKHFETNQAWQVADSAKELLETLKGRKFPMGVISNFDPRVHQILKNVQLHHYFSFILTSYETGFEKPDKRIFEKAREKSGVDKIVHIGNDRFLDFDGARLAGFDAILVDLEGKHLDLKMPHRVDSLKSVESSLEFFM